VLPAADHVARICSFTSLDAGEPTAASFQPHPGGNGREADDALSVHWLECLLAAGAMVDKVASLRKFLLEDSPFEERKPTAKGRIAVISVAALHEKSEPETGATFQCRNTPRDLTLLDPDPHSEVHTDPEILKWPADQTFRLAIQQFICDQVVHHEPGVV
jgi:hypothetical protein